MATLSPAVKHEASTISPSWSSSVDVPSKVAGNASPGVKQGEVRSDSVTLTRKGFETVRFLSRRRIRFFRMRRDRSSTSSCKENSGLFLLKLFSALLSLMNGPSWPRRMTPKGPGLSSLYKSPGSLYVSHLIPVPLTASHESFGSRRSRFSTYTHWPRKYRILGTRSRSKTGGGVAGLLLGGDDEGVRAECGVVRSTELDRYGLVTLLSE